MSGSHRDEYENGVRSVPKMTKKPISCLHDLYVNCVRLFLKIVKKLFSRPPARADGALNLKRALVFWRIVDSDGGAGPVLYARRLEPDGREESWEWRVFDGDRSSSLTAKMFLAGCDLAGFGCNARSKRLVSLFANAGLDLGIGQRRVVDIELIFGRYYPRLGLSASGNMFESALCRYGITPLNP